MSWTMSITISLWVVLAFSSLLTVTSLKHKNLICDQFQDCVCGFPTGQGINLTNLASNTLKFNDTKNGLVFYLNPCSDAHAPCPNGTSFCVFDEVHNLTVILGYKAGTSFSSQGVYNPVFLDYKNNDGIRTQIKLECRDAPETTLLLNEDISHVDPNLGIKHHLVLQSSEACLKYVEFLQNDANEGLSSGAVFFLILLVLFCVYFFVGAATNHFLRGATGWEVIPNYGFWKSIPNAFLDGLKFIANGCRPPPSYEQI